MKMLMKNGFLTKLGFLFLFFSTSLNCGSRFACDGLKRQRLTSPMLKGSDGNLAPASWEDAIVSVAKMLDSAPADNIAAVAGGLCDAEVLSQFCYGFSSKFLLLVFDGIEGSFQPSWIRSCVY